MQHLQRTCRGLVGYFKRDMLFDIPFVADWNQIGDYRQSQTDRSNKRENNKRVD
jgi:hypothetical protein